MKDGMQEDLKTIYDDPAVAHFVSNDRNRRDLEALEKIRERRALGLIIVASDKKLKSPERASELIERISELTERMGCSSVELAAMREASKQARTSEARSVIDRKLRNIDLAAKRFMAEYKARQHIAASAASKQTEPKAEPAIDRQLASVQGKVVYLAAVARRHGQRQNAVLLPPSEAPTLKAA